MTIWTNIFKKKQPEAKQSSIASDQLFPRNIPNHTAQFTIEPTSMETTPTIEIPCRCFQCDNFSESPEQFCQKYNFVITNKYGGCKFGSFSKLMEKDKQNIQESKNRAGILNEIGFVNNGIGIKSLADNISPSSHGTYENYGVWVVSNAKPVFNHSDRQEDNNEKTKQD